ncbi:MAG: zinc ribbon domain-containing protein [Chloroflexota bacterium]|nr:zinc ribbon domain-containing protein [Chloroflexota bacterium]
MPIYEYECPKCGERFEQRRSIADCDSQAECPKCGAVEARRVLSVFALGSSGTACAPSSPT